MPGAALFRSLHGEYAEWGLAEQLQHTMEHTLRVLAWHNTKDGERGRNYPEPLPAPWIKPVNTAYGKGAIPLEDMAAWLGWPQPSMN